MLKQIISGAQTGADQGALDAAINLGFPHGGWTLKGRQTEDGILPDRFYLHEMVTGSYPKCIKKNVLCSDGTVIITHGELNGRTSFAKKCAQKHDRPFIHINLRNTSASQAASEIHSWIVEHDIEIMNVTGSQTGNDPEIYKDIVYIIESVILLAFVKARSGSLITDYHIGEYLEKLPVPPKTVDQAVDRLISDLDLKDKVFIANMDFNELVNLHSSLHLYLKNAFGLRSANIALMESCRCISDVPVNNETDATAVIIGVLWKKLHKTYKLRIVK
jgi:hypothetical protein